MIIMDFDQKGWSCEGLKKCCSDCKTTKTPLWRGGPAGPKSLCNACGIRYRKRKVSTVGLKSKGEEKKRDRVEENDSSSNTTISGTCTSSTTSSAETIGTESRESMKVKLMALPLVEEVLLQGSKQRRKMLGEEEQAAVCLMALSCGFVFA